MDVQIFDSREVAEASVADEISRLVTEQARTVLGLASGDSPTGVYRELLRRQREGALSLSGLRTFTLDEYLGPAADDPRSFRHFMRTRLLDPAGIPLEHAYVPGGWDQRHAIGAAELNQRCDEFERAILREGGIDLQLLGIGRNGHIGFNEPGSSSTSRTRVVELHDATRQDAERGNAGISPVPTHAITMGVATILEARRIRVLAFGAAKRDVVARTMRRSPDPSWPASFLHQHRDARLIVDREAVADPVSAETQLAMT